MTEYNKAIRDKIPEIIKESGFKCAVKELSDDEFLTRLEEKLIEELEEYDESKSVEELADILEVVYRIADLKGTPKDLLDEIRQKKFKERGGFEKNLFLIDTEKNDYS